MTIIKHNLLIIEADIIKKHQEAKNYNVKLHWKVFKMLIIREIPWIQAGHFKELDRGVWGIISCYPPESFQKLPNSWTYPQPRSKPGLAGEWCPKNGLSMRHWTSVAHLLASVFGGANGALYSELSYNRANAVICFYRHQ